MNFLITGVKIIEVPATYGSLYTYAVQKHEGRQLDEEHWVDLGDALEGKNKSNAKLSPRLVGLIEILNKFFKQSS